MGRKLVFIGGGSPYVPAIVSEILSNVSCFYIKEIVFISRTNTNSLSISAFCQALLESKGMSPIITNTTSVDEHICDADAIFLIYRVGGLDTRKLDETIGLDLNVISQESQGVGGFSSALRHIDLLNKISGNIKKFAPNAIIFCLTNPTGIITGAALELGLNAVGVCDAPYALAQDIAIQMDIPYEELQFDYVGLNHLGWITDVTYQGQSVIDNIMNQEALLNVLHLPYEITVSNNYIEFIRSIKAIPSPYLAYYYFKREIVEKQKKNKRTRAEEVSIINEKLYKNFNEKNLTNWPYFFQNLRSGYLLGVSLSNYICDIFGESSGKRHIICVKNDNIFSNISSDAIVEVPVIVNGNITLPAFNHRNIQGNIYSLISSVSEYEQLTIKAGLTGDKNTALLALASHPTINSIEIAVELFSRVMDINRDYCSNLRINR